MIIEIKDESAMKLFGKAIGLLLCGGENIELIGDVGAGKTTLVKGLATGLGIDDSIQSPSFTINRVYEGRDNITLSHYDFYRLEDAGIMSNELNEVVNDESIVTVVEWGGAVSEILPHDRLRIAISSTSENSRSLLIESGGAVSERLKAGLAK